MSRTEGPGPHDVGVGGGDGGGFGTRVAPGDRSVLTIDALVAGGRGIGRVGGAAWFVDGAVAGDTVEAEVARVHDRWIEARAVRLLLASPVRREPPCPIQSACGGCPWMVLPEGAQRDWKKRLLTDALTRIGRFVDPPIGEVSPSPSALGYRNKIELAFGRDHAGRRILGFHGGGGGRRLEDVARCLLVDPVANAILETARRFFLEGRGVEDPALDAVEEPVRLVLRRSHATGRHLVALRGGPGAMRSAEPFAREARRRHPEVAGVVRLVAPPGRRGGTRTIPLDGDDALDENLAGLRFRVPAGTFFQVNPEAAEVLARLVVAFAGAPGRVIELYGGVGVFGLALSRSGASSVTIVEADSEAAAAGRHAARTHRLDRVRFLRADAARGLEAAAHGQARADVLVADPPRTGLGRGLAEQIVAAAPLRIVLVGCDPATFARDLYSLAAGGYRLERVEAVDLFPQTAHVEAVALLKR